ncbi:hypothetical protein GOBAR_DD17665 [Gossypium barbadense]|nr:hypothetical protein GOBAR_DD17665 [Gossypium barbadense]
MDSSVEWLLFLVVFLSISPDWYSEGSSRLEEASSSVEESQRYVINYKYWGGGAVIAPIFVCLGAEQALETDLQTIGFLDDNAARFNALIVYIEETSESCYQTIRRSWSVIDSYASQPWGLSVLSSKFRTCYPLNSASELKKELESIYVVTSQFNQPAYLVNRVCAAIDETQTDDILFKIFAAVVAFNGNNRCYINPPTPESQTVTGWKWQTCSEMVIPIGVGENTMFQPNPFDLNTFINDCIRTYGVAPRPHWITSYYGGNDFNFILQKFGSNIIFSNGLRDPFSAGGVLEHISKSIRAVTTTYGSHCLDLFPKSDNDPEWLTKQRNIELRIIKGWLVTYYADLKAFQKG